MDVEELKSRVRRGEKPKYLLFWGHRDAAAGLSPSCLSQWYPSRFLVEGQAYPSAEHWMMAEEARLFGDAEMLHRILEAGSPAQAKQLGGMVRGFVEEVWRARRFDIVVAGNLHKFGQNPDLAGYLATTGRKFWSKQARWIGSGALGSPRKPPT